jgi:DNA-binding GntR family transcriptional regulator
MNKPTTASVYRKLHDDLRVKVRDGGFAAGDQFLTEREIAGSYQVSRVTANKALSRLVAEGWLEFRQGAGTFVRGDVLDYDLGHLVSFTEKAKAAGKKPDTKVLAFEKLIAADVNKTVRTGLKMGSEEEVFYFERLRLADGSPVIFERRWVVVRLCPKLTQTNVRGSLYSLWTDKFGLEIAGVDEVIRAVNLSAKQAALLDVLPQTAGLLVQSIGYVGGDQPLWWEETLYRTDVYEFRNRLGGLKTARPAVGQFTKS